MHALDDTRHPRWADINATAAYCSVAPSTIRAWTRTGYIRAAKIGNVKRWDLNEVDDYLFASMTINAT